MKIPFQFETFILGKTDFHLRNFNIYLFDILLLAGKKNITRHWLGPETPKLEDWADIVCEIYVMEKITFSLRLQMDRFKKLWLNWVAYARRMGVGLRGVAF